MNITEILQTIEDLHFMRDQALAKAAESKFWAEYEDILHVALLSTIEAVKEACE